MSSFELPSSVAVNKGEKKSQETSTIKKIALAAAVVGPLIAGADVASAAETPNPLQTKVERTEKEGESVIREEDIRAKLEEAERMLFAKVDSLGLFSAPEFIQMVKSNSNTIRSFLKDPEKVPACEAPLQEILNVYALPLKMAKYRAPELYLRTAAQFHQALLVVETESLPNIKGKLQKIFKT